jgi:DNA replication protein DnaC
MTQIFNQILEQICKESNEVCAIPKIQLMKYVSQDKFAKLYIKEANLYIKNLGKSHTYIIDDNNKDILGNLKYWLFNDEKCIFDLNKGILLLGPVGCGKTLILETFCKLYNRIAKKIISPLIMITNSRVLRKEIIVDPQQHNRRHLYIDDLGKEPNHVNNYGTDEKPIAELFYYRSRCKVFTFGTANYNLESFAKFYGTSTVDRFKDIFNIVELKGESKRK